MKTLLVVRHAKSEPAGGSTPDRDREITAGGCQDAQTVGAEIARRGVVPGLVLASDSTRSRQTTAVLVEQFENQPEIEFLPELYSGPASTLLDAAATAADRAQTLMIVAHNPGIETLVSRIAKHEVRVRTSTVAVMEIVGEQPTEDHPLAGLTVTDIFGPADLG